MARLFVCVCLLVLPAIALAGEANEAARVAETFLNDYVRASAKFSDSYESAIAWVKRNPRTAPAFRTALEKLYRDASKKDPELGYGADAIVGGQDFPDRFTVAESRVSGIHAYVVLTGPPSFPMKVPVRLIAVNEQWKVDGSGDLAGHRPKGL